MAKIVTTRTTVQDVSASNPPVEGDATDRITVRSAEGGLDVSMLRDFVNALDAANAPGETLVGIERRSSDMRLSGFVAEWSVVPEETTERIDR